VVRVVRNPELDPALIEELSRVWVAVTNAGGAVGFVAPVTIDEVRAAAEAAFGHVRSGRDDLVVAYADGPAGEEPVGWGLLMPNEWPTHAHWAWIRRLQRHPDRRAAGIGDALLSGLEDAARARGLERLVLSVRGGTGREGFYLARGFTLEARLPGRVRVGPGDDREELVMSKPLLGGASSGPVLRVRRLDRGLPLPAYAREGDAGLDLHAAEDVELAPGERAVVGTGLAVALPPGTVGLVHPRSGLAARHGLGLVNAPGTIDEGYRGEVRVVLVNLDRSEPVRLRRGDRIAQLVVQRVERVAVEEAEDLEETARADGGLGSTGR
jgi:dUTP pyrophosphatase